MKRFVIAILATVAGVTAWVMPAPDIASGAVDELPEPVAGTRSEVWFCPGAAAEVDPIVTAAVLAPGIVGFSLPVAGEVLDSFQNRIPAGVGDWDVGDGLFFHPGPSIVETSSSPSAAAVVYRGPAQVAADGCYTAAKEWFLNGATMRPSETLTLRLFNPLLEQGRVLLQVVTEFGFEPLLDLETMSIGPRAWEDVSLSLVLGDREQVAVQVSVTEGVVIPSLHAVGPNGLSVWPGESPSSTWEFPLVQTVGTTGEISVWNPGSEPADVSIELMGSRGPVGGFDLSVGPGREERYDVSSLTTAEVGAVIRSTVAVVAAVRSDGPGGTAATVGVPRPGARWLVPAHGIVPDLSSFVWVLNSGDDPVDVAAQPIGADSGTTRQVSGHSIARLDVSGRGADITATGPVSAAWVVVGAGDVGLGLGVPITAQVP